MGLGFRSLGLRFTDVWLGAWGLGCKPITAIHFGTEVNG